MIKHYALSKNWKFRRSDTKTGPRTLTAGLTRWLPATVPGTVHTDLMANKKIRDPFKSDNERELYWICQNNWQYQLSFDLPPDFNRLELLYLVFEGVDSFAEIILNNHTIGHTENMFRSYRWEISRYIKPKRNILEVIFTSPFAKYDQIRRDKDMEFNTSWEPRVYLRKAQYSFGWDWGPTFPTMGIWRPVYLEQYKAVKIRAVRFFTTEITTNKARIKVVIDCEGESNRISAIVLKLSDHGIKYEHKLSPDAHPTYTADLVIPEPRLWWPNGMGDANLYDLEVLLFDNEQNIFDRWHKKVGVRTVELQRSEAGRAVFRFLVNGEAVYIKGANWIPADSFLPRIEYQKYKSLLAAARSAHMNMIRVWGGGIYEDDLFYQLCDELGLLVWQDFMFACAPYPEYPEFLQNIQEELKQNVLRLQPHPAVAIWCGNNENEWIWQRNGNHHPEAMPGYSIYHQLIPLILKKLDPERPYWPSSPFGDGQDPNSMTSGNRHQWDIWSFWSDYSNVTEDQSLFVTEFGFQAPANRQTLEDVIPRSMRYIQSKIFEWHNKQTEGNERLIRFLAGHLPVRVSWGDYIYLTQLNQGFALKTCLEHWRRRWPDTGGSIIWQLNDCWPVSSWSLIDSNLKPKLGYFFVRQAFHPDFVCFEKGGAEFPLQLFCETSQIGVLSVIVYQLSTGKIIIRDSFKVNGSGMDRKKWDIELPRSGLGENWIAVASLIGNDGALINRNYYIPGRWKHQRIADPKINLREKKDRLEISCKKPAYFIDLYHPRYHFEDRGFILLPGEKKDIKIPSGISIKDIKIYSLNYYLC